MQILWQNLRYGARMLRKQPGFTLVAVLTLALGIGANTALFSLVDKLILQSLPVNDPETLVQFKAESVNPKLTFRQFAWADFLDYRRHNTVFTDLTAFKQATVNLGEGDQLERVRAELVAENYFALFGIQPLLGRTFTAEENRAPNSHPLAVLSYHLWQSRFGGAANVIGQSVMLNERTYTIVGVTPARFRGVKVDAPTDVWVPAMMLAHIEQRKATDEQVNDWMSKRYYMMWTLFGRLKPGVSLAAAEPAIDALARQLHDGRTEDAQLPFNITTTQLEDVTEGLSNMRDEFGRPLLFVFGIVGAILLIACANLAGLLLARAALRRKEIAVRLALGAGRWRLIGQLLTESLMLAGLGGLFGVLLAPWLMDLLLSFQTRNDVQLDQTINGRVAVFAFGLSLLTGVLFGLLPAWQASKPDVTLALKDESLLSRDGRGFIWSRRGLIVTQIALSFVVLISAGLFVRTLRQYLAIEPGFNADNVLVAAFELPESKYDAARANQFFQQLRERLQTLPGVVSVAQAENTPFSGYTAMTALIVEGQPVQPNEAPRVDMNKVGAGYHELLGVSIEQGRGFTDADRKGQPAVATINAAFAQKFFTGQNPIGRRIRPHPDEDKTWLTIVGVTGNIKSFFLDGEINPQIEMPLAQQNVAGAQSLLLRTRTDAAALLPQVRREVRALDAGLSYFKATTMRSAMKTQFASQEMAATLTSLFGLVALALTALGLYGVIAYAVTQRTREIGIRIALGAQTGDVLRLILREGVLLVGVGLAAGLAGAFAAGRLIETFLYGVRPHDPLTFVAVAILLIAVALLACLIPARRATKVDPMVALRCE